MACAGSALADTRCQPADNRRGAFATQTLNSTRRGDVTTVHAPASTMPRTPRHAARGSNDATEPGAACSIVGVCQSPAQRPRSPRRSSTSPRASRMTKVSQCTVGRAAFAATAGMRSADPSRWAMHRDRHGHEPQRGARGVQVSAPNSISPSFIVAADEARSTKSCAVDQSHSCTARSAGSWAHP
jgi:hypothetical protein